MFARLGVLAGRVLSSPPPTDPLGATVAQDPDSVRANACRIVERDPSVCAPKVVTTQPAGGGGGGFDLSFVSFLLWALLIAAFVGLVFVVVRSLAGRGGRGGRRPKVVRDGDDELERDVVAVDRNREPVNWRAEAEEHRRAGRYRDAVRCRYRALVGDLARRGLIDEIPGRTTGEERAQMGRVVPGASRPFNAAAELFDGAWYGRHDVGERDDDRFQTLEHDVLDSATAARR